MEHINLIKEFLLMVLSRWFTRLPPLQIYSALSKNVLTNFSLENPKKELTTTDDI